VIILVKVLKIGGSVLTSKKGSARARHAEIKRVAEEIAEYSEELVFIHGAGSFGHSITKKYGLPESLNLEGLRVTHQTVAKLNNLIVKALSEAGANPMPVHPFSCTLLRNGRIENFAIKPILEMIGIGLMPVLHGDVAMDLSRGLGIISGDQLVQYLARILGAKIAAIGTNVDGVIFRGNVLPNISRSNLHSIDNELRGSHEVDVTGGMRGKLMELLELADIGIESVIFNASCEGQIEKVLRGEHIGTLVTRQN
jgi:isopentenyl phosphate kinase